MQLTHKTMAAFVMVFIFFFCSSILTSCGSFAYEAVSGSSSEDTSSDAESAMSQDSTSGSSSGNQENDNDSEKAGSASASSDVLVVYVCGAVASPGVYELPAGSRVYAAIAAAGGITQNADPRQINQAAELTDGQQITVLTKEELEKGTAVPGADAGGTTAAASAAGTEVSGAKVNINTASAQELTSLPGIGDSRALDIISYRTENGGFKSIEDIMKVSGIKTALFNRIKDKITVN